jgi:hypothetical protein
MTSVEGGSPVTKNSSPAKSKAKKKTLAPDEVASTRVGFLLKEAEKFCTAVDLHKDMMLEIYNAENDWTFVLKIDALLETATKEIIKSGLKLKILNRFVGGEALAEFVDGLSMNGKTSIIRLLRASGCPSEDCDFVEAVRRVRNAYAHNIKLDNLPLIGLIKQRPDNTAAQ